MKKAERRESQENTEKRDGHIELRKGTKPNGKVFKRNTGSYKCKS